MTLDAVAWKFHDGTGRRHNWTALQIYSLSHCFCKPHQMKQPAQKKESVHAWIQNQINHNQQGGDQPINYLLEEVVEQNQRKQKKRN